MGNEWEWWNADNEPREQRRYARELRHAAYWLIVACILAFRAFITILYFHPPD